VTRDVRYRCPENEKAGKPGLFVSYLGDALGVLGQRLDALGAVRLADEHTVFLDLHNLQIRVKLPPRRSHGETAGIAELRLLATRCTNRHERIPVLLPKLIG
jgi:hypothetical protein